MEEAPSQISVHLVRYEVRGWTAAQGLGPLAVAAAVAAQRFPNRWVVVPAFVLLALTIALYVRARKSFGSTQLALGRHKLESPSAGVEISQKTCSRWTLVRTTARVYGSRFSYKLRVSADDREPLARALQRALGRATPLRRRGSLRARVIAAAICAAGFACLGAAIALNLVQLIFVAVPAIIVGFATFMALSQRIADG